MLVVIALLLLIIVLQNIKRNKLLTTMAKNDVKLADAQIKNLHAIYTQLENK